MACTSVRFASTEWTAGAHPLERKKIPGSRPVALLDFGAGFEDPKLCERAHVIYVLSGTLEIELTDREVIVNAGDACVLDAGTAHRAKSSAGCRLFVVSEIDVPER